MRIALAHPYHTGKSCSKFGEIPPRVLGGDSVTDRRKASLPLQSLPYLACMGSLYQIFISCAIKYTIMSFYATLRQFAQLYAPLRRFKLLRYFTVFRHTRFIISSVTVMLNSTNPSIIYEHEF